MPLTTTEQVQTILLAEYSVGDDLTPFIEAADQLVLEKCSGKGYSDSRMEMIERWLAAHFYKIYAPETQSEMAEEVQQSYAVRVALGLQATRYGQQALILDTQGGLAAVNAASNTGGGAETKMATLGGFWCPPYIPRGYGLY